MMMIPRMRRSVASEQRIRLMEESRASGDGPADGPPVERKAMMIPMIGLLIFIGSVLVWYWGSVFSSPTMSLSVKSPRFVQQCNQGEPTGAEGSPSSSGLAALGVKEVELLSVVIAHRHGDRSAIHDMPGALSNPEFNCGAEEFQEVWDSLPQRFRIVSATDHITPLHRQLTPELKSGSQHVCGRGQLTARGFRQLAALGSHLSTAYSGFLERLVLLAAASEASANELLYVRSTDYTRTIGSVASLLTSLMPSSYRPWPYIPVVIEVNEDEANEIMHGIGTKSSSKAGDGAAEKVIEGSCPAAARYHSSQMRAWHRPEALYAQIESMFGEAAAERSVTDLCDAAYAAACHGMPFMRGPGGEMTEQMAEEFSAQADRFYCERYAGNQGGKRATELAMYPFIKEVLERLEANAASGKPHLAVYSGHDTVVAAVLAAIGLYTDHRCRWAPYASRIIFELYRAADASNTFIRVVFNGEVQHGLLGCSEGIELCPLSNFSAGVASLLHGAQSIEDACV
mmetsp:Transcript_42930/g.100830  ORF Transcript_42930/g.100830 Transcript_42930/m.100830 type:complete len:513 (-) Transcript_42930:31-1569(-)